jgi:ribosomal protein L11 methyltransferase
MFELTVKTGAGETTTLWIGQRLIVLPAGCACADRGGRIPIWIEAGGSFGTGEHPTTRLCLRAMERHLRAGDSVTDIGTGTGILAVAAAKLGAGGVLAADIDPQAVQNALQNVLRNGVESRIRVIRGSVREVLGEPPARGPAAMVVVNISAGVIEELFSLGLAGSVQPEGLLVLSGFLSMKTPAVRARLQSDGFQLLAREREGEWICLITVRMNAKKG